MSVMKPEQTKVGTKKKKLTGCYVWSIYSAGDKESRFRVE